MNKEEVELLKQIPADRLCRIMQLLDLGILSKVGDKMKINGKYAFKFQSQHGVPPECLEDWVNSYIKTGKAKL